MTQNPLMEKVRNMGREAARKWDAQNSAHFYDRMYERENPAPEPQRPVCPFLRGTLRTLWIEGYESTGNTWREEGR